MDRPRSTLSKGLVLAFAYYLTAVLSLSVALVEDVVTPIWPASGIAVVCLLIWGRRLWPWITLAAFAVNLSRTPTPLAALGVATGNTLAPLLAATLLKRVRFDPLFRRMADSLALVFLGALGSMTVSATAGTATLLASHAISRDEFAGTWSVWWAGDALGVLVFAPLILSFRHQVHRPAESAARTVEALALLFLLGLAASQVFQLSVPVRYLLFPLLVWAALRFGMLGASIATLIVTSFAVGAATSGTDPLAGGTLMERMLVLQLLNATAALTAFVLAASWTIRRRTAEDLKSEAAKLEEAVERRTVALRTAMERLEKEVLTRKLSESSLAERERQLAEAESLAHVGSWTWDIASDTISWSDELFRIYGLEKQDVKLAYRKYLQLQHPEDIDRLAAKMLQALEHGAPYRIEHRIVRPDGSVRWVRGQAKVVMGEDGPVRLTGAAQDITEQKLAEDLLRESEERYRGLFEQAPEAILVIDVDTRKFVEVNRAGERLLGRPRRELYGVDVFDTFAPVQPDGRTAAEVGTELIEQVPAGGTAQFEWLLLHSSGRPILCEVRIFYLPNAGRRLVRASLVDITERRKLEHALREAQDKERELRQQRQIAHTLQRSLLPESLPEPPGVRLAVRYLPGSEGLEVGGDWYDAFELDDGSLAVVVGDIVGRGLKAAATMGQLRTALRAYALHDSSPRSVMNRLTDLVDRLLDAEMATLIYAVYERDARTLTYSSAGHPPALVVLPNGESSYLQEGRSPPLGIPELSFTEAKVALGPGSTLVLYTDGLVERRGASIDEGLDDLAAAASQACRRGGDLEEITSRILRSVASGQSLQDDTALLTLQVAAVQTSRFVFSSPAEPERLTALRHAIMSWLQANGANEEEAQDLVLAVTEAAANAVLHAYGPGEGTFTVEAERDGSVVSVVVSDRGSWRTGRSKIGGRGLNLMQALVDSVQVSSGESGTEVMLQRHLGRPLPEPRPPEHLFEHRVADTPGAGNHVAVVEIAEDVDLANAQRIGAGILNNIGNDKLGLVVDLRRLDHLDSSGLGMLMHLNRNLGRRRMQLCLVAADGSPVYRILEVAEIGSVVPIVHTVDEAVDSILSREEI